MQIYRKTNPEGVFQLNKAADMSDNEFLNLFKKFENFENPKNLKSGDSIDNEFEPLPYLLPPRDIVLKVLS